MIEEMTDEGLQVYGIFEVTLDGMRKIYCTVAIPSDLYDGESDKDSLRIDYARYMAHELWPHLGTPADWFPVWNGTDEVRVGRWIECKHGH